MVSPHRIDVFNFEFWRGTQPVLPFQNVTTHVKPGTDGVGQIRSGFWGASFTSELEAHYPNYAGAMLGFFLIGQVIGTGPVNIRYNDREFLGDFGVRYFVDDVKLKVCEGVPRLIGRDYDYIGGGRLVVDVKLTPHKITEET